MSKETFLYSCNKLTPTLKRTDTILRWPLSVEQRVAVALWCLGTPTEYRTIAHLFGIARSTMCETVHEVYQCILNVLMKDYIQFPLETSSIKWLINLIQNGVYHSALVSSTDHMYQYQPQEICTLITITARGGTQY